MHGFLRYILLLTLLAAPGSLVGQENALPKVLVLGDSVYRQPASDASKELKGRVQVVYATVPLGGICNSGTALAHLDALLGDGQWDVIHFNFGLGDLIYRVPGIKSFRVLPIDAGGVRATDPLQYEQNLREVVAQLKATGAKLIWANTTPIRHSRSNVFELGTEVQYNSIAAKVMADEGVAVNDMYTYVVKQIDMERPASHGADPFSFDRKPLHPPMVQSILSALELDSTD